MDLAARIGALATRTGNYLRDSVLPRLLPSGGTSGQVLAKSSGTDYDVSWTTPSGGTAATTWQRSTLTIPAGTSRQKAVNLVAAGVTLASIVPCSVVGLPPSAINDAEETSTWEVIAEPMDGSINFNFTAPGPFMGPVDVIYMVQ